MTLDEVVRKCRPPLCKKHPSNALYHRHLTMIDACFYLYVFSCSFFFFYQFYREGACFYLF